MAMEGTKEESRKCATLSNSSLPDSWENADLEEQMKALNLKATVQNPKAHSWEVDGTVNERNEISGSAYANPGDGSITPTGLTKQALELVDDFLREALQKPQNPRDRLTILRLDQEAERFLRNPNQQVLEFQPLPTSYLRLAAHRVAQHYLLQSFPVDAPSGESGRIVLKKISESRLPPVRLSEIQEISNGNVTGYSVSSPSKVVLKQRSRSVGQELALGSGAAGSQFANIKSVEKRKEEYVRARARIFSASSGGSTVTEDDPPRHESPPASVTDIEKSESRPALLVSEKSGNGTPGEEMRSKAGGGRKSNDGGNRGRGGRVAIFRDREKDRQDPDYNRSYDRFSQRFDPGFGMAVATSYGVQPIYTPVVSYSSEFPSLGPMGVGARGGLGTPANISVDQIGGSIIPGSQLQRGWLPARMPAGGHSLQQQAMAFQYGAADQMAGLPYANTGSMGAMAMQAGGVPLYVQQQSQAMGYPTAGGMHYYSSESFQSSSVQQSDVQTEQHFPTPTAPRR